MTALSAGMLHGDGLAMGVGTPGSAARPSISSRMSRAHAPSTPPESPRTSRPSSTTTTSPSKLLNSAVHSLFSSRPSPPPALPRSPGTKGKKTSEQGMTAATRYAQQIRDGLPLTPEDSPPRTKSTKSVLSPAAFVESISGTASRLSRLGLDAAGGRAGPSSSSKVPRERPRALSPKVSVRARARSRSRGSSNASASEGAAAGRRWRGEQGKKRTSATLLRSVTTSGDVDAAEPASPILPRASLDFLDGGAGADSSEDDRLFAVSTQERTHRHRKTSSITSSAPSGHSRTFSSSATRSIRSVDPRTGVERVDVETERRTWRYSLPVSGSSQDERSRPSTPTRPRTAETLHAFPSLHRRGESLDDDDLRPFGPLPTSSRKTTSSDSSSSYKRRSAPPAMQPLHAQPLLRPLEKTERPRVDKEVLIDSMPNAPPPSSPPPTMYQLTSHTLPFIKPLMNSVFFVSLSLVAIVSLSFMLFASYGLTFFDDLSKHVPWGPDLLGRVRSIRVGIPRGRAWVTWIVGDKPQGETGGNKRGTSPSTSAEPRARPKKARSSSRSSRLVSPSRGGTKARERQNSSQADGWTSDEGGLPFDVPNPTPQESRAGTAAPSRAMSEDEGYEVPGAAPRVRKAKHSSSSSSPPPQPTKPALPPRPHLTILVPSIIFALLVTIWKLLSGGAGPTRDRASADARNDEKRRQPPKRPS